MPSKRKRIGYLPSINAQEMIINIANKEELSQSKVVGILVEEALLARGRLGLDHKYRNELIRKTYLRNENILDDTTYKYNDLDELISDKGITYNKKKYKYDSEEDLEEAKATLAEELYEQFKQFILFQKMTQNK